MVTTACLISQARENSERSGGGRGGAGNRFSGQL